MSDKLSDFYANLNPLYEGVDDDASREKTYRLTLKDWRLNNIKKSPRDVLAEYAEKNGAQGVSALSHNGKITYYFILQNNDDAKTLALDELTGELVVMSLNDMRKSDELRDEDEKNPPISSEDEEFIAQESPDNTMTEGFASFAERLKELFEARLGQGGRQTDRAPESEKLSGEPNEKGLTVDGYNILMKGPLHDSYEKYFGGVKELAKKTGPKTDYLKILGFAQACYDEVNEIPVDAVNSGFAKVLTTYLVFGSLSNDFSKGKTTSTNSLTGDERYNAVIDYIYGKADASGKVAGENKIEEVMNQFRGLAHILIDTLGKEEEAIQDKADATEDEEEQEIILQKLDNIREFFAQLIEFGGKVSKDEITANDYSTVLNISNEFNENFTETKAGKEAYDKISVPLKTINNIFGRAQAAAGFSQVTPTSTKEGPTQGLVSGKSAYNLVKAYLAVADRDVKNASGNVENAYDASRNSVISDFQNIGGILNFENFRNWLKNTYYFGKKMGEFVRSGENIFNSVLSSMETKHPDSIVNDTFSEDPDIKHIYNIGLQGKRYMDWLSSRIPTLHHAFEGRLPFGFFPVTPEFKKEFIHAITALLTIYYLVDLENKAMTKQLETQSLPTEKRLKYEAEIRGLKKFEKEIGVLLMDCINELSFAGGGVQVKDVSELASGKVRRSVANSMFNGLQKTLLDKNKEVKSSILGTLDGFLETRQREELRVANEGDGPASIPDDVARSSIAYVLDSGIGKDKLREIEPSEMTPSELGTHEKDFDSSFRNLISSIEAKNPNSRFVTVSDAILAKGGNLLSKFNKSILDFTDAFTVRSNGDMFFGSEPTGVKLSDAEREAAKKATLEKANMAYSSLATLADTLIEAIDAYFLSTRFRSTTFGPQLAQYKVLLNQAKAIMTGNSDIRAKKDAIHLILDTEKPKTVAPQKTIPSQQPPVQNPNSAEARVAARKEKANGKPKPPENLEHENDDATDAVEENEEEVNWKSY